MQCRPPRKLDHGDKVIAFDLGKESPHFPPHARTRESICDLHEHPARRQQPPGISAEKRQHPVMRKIPSIPPRQKKEGIREAWLHGRFGAPCR
jgi:hypothetical protein